MTAEDERRIGEILCFVGLSDLSAETAYERLEQLSMGERQRVGFARCLLKDAKLWIPDEPGVALKKGACIQLIHAVNAFAGAVILSSHDEEASKETAHTGQFVCKSIPFNLFFHSASQV